MTTRIRKTRHKARKILKDFLGDYYEHYYIKDCGMTADEIDILQERITNKWKILPGMEYTRDVNIGNDGIYSICYLPHVLAIFEKYDLLEYDN
jgi:hypothetical protein